MKIKNKKRRTNCILSFALSSPHRKLWVKKKEVPCLLCLGVSVGGDKKSIIVLSALSLPIAKWAILNLG